MISITNCIIVCQKLTFDPFTSQMSTPRRNRTDIGQTEGSPTAEAQKRRADGTPGTEKTKNPSQKAKFVSALRRGQESETESEPASDDLVTDEDQEGHSSPFHSHTSRVHTCLHICCRLHMSTEPEAELELDTYASK